MDLFADLNEPQRQAVAHVDGPLLILAGAGSGKTRVITRRLAHLIQQGVAPWHILAITFTNKAAGEMAERVHELNCPSGAMVCTFHALCARLLREYAVEAGLKPNYSIYDRDDQLRLVKSVMTRLDLPTGNFTPGQIHSTISHAKNDMKTAEQYAATSGGRFYERNVAAVYREYERALTESNALDFDDLLLRVAGLLRDRPDIREALGRRFQYVMIDEYQDTNRAQYLLAHGIAMDHENIAVTGDPDQSIYAWRGADIRNILEFEKDYPNAVVIRLEENYRSTTPILAAASRLISHNKMRKDKALWTRRAGGSKVRLVCCDDEHAEARYIAQQIADRRSRGGNCDDVAVFYRVNALSRVLEEALIQRAIPYRIARGVEFYNRKEVKDVLGYLRCLVNPADDVSCQRIINTPARGIGATTVDRLAEFAERMHIPLREACKRAGEAGLGDAATKKVLAFSAMMDKLAEDLTGPVQGIMENVLRESGLEESLRKDDEDTRQARANVAELVSTAAEFDEMHDGATLADYLHQVSLVSDVDHFEGSGAVTLMTLHAAKGLEFPVVFIVGCEDGLLPFQRMADNGNSWGGPKPSQKDMEEERRLAFVGITRAMDELTLTCARVRMLRGRHTPQPASPFVGEIGKENLDAKDLTTPVTARFSRPAAAGAPAAGGYYQDVEERSVIEALHDENAMPSEYQYLKEGSRVNHPKFGRGKVQRLRQKWPDTRVEVLFDRFGPKTLVLSKTSLELLD